jgi:hypothetical protein
VSIFAFGGEMGFFIPSDSDVIESTGVSYNSAFARCLTRVRRTTNYAETPTISAQDDFWFHFEDLQTNAASGGFSAWATLYDSGGIGRIRVRSGGDNTTLYMDYYNGTAWTEIGNILIAMNDLQTFDIHVVSNTASGSATLYVAGTERIVSGTLDLSAFTGITKARFTGRGSNAITCGPSQVVMADEPTIGMRVGTIVMTGQGTTHTFATGGFGNIDEIVYSDADFIESDTAAQVELFTGTAIPTFTNYTIRAIALTARAKTDGTAPTKFRFILRSGGTSYDNGSDLTLGFGYGGYCAVWETNPDTSAAFLASEISALEFGVKSVT